MSKVLFSERVNALSNILNEMTPDPSERLGVVTVLGEMYKYELQSYFTRIPSNSKQGESNADATNTGADTVSGSQTSPGNAPEGSNT